MNQENQRIILGPDGNPVHSQPAAGAPHTPIVDPTGAPAAASPVAHTQPAGNPVAPGGTSAPSHQPAATPASNATRANNGDEMVIPVVQEFMTVDKEVVETSRVNVHKTVHQEEKTLNIPLLSEYYDVQRVPRKEVYEKAPVPRQEGDVIIVPVVKEILVIEKRYEVTEEVHLIRKTTATPHIETITLLKEHVEVVRTDQQGRKKRL